MKHRSTVEVVVVLVILALLMIWGHFAAPGTAGAGLRVPPAVFGARATWYCNPGVFPAAWSPCTFGHPWFEHGVAVPQALAGRFRHGSTVVLWHGSKHVAVRVVDVCVCGTWDIYASAFGDIASLGEGRIEIAVEVPMR